MASHRHRRGVDQLRTHVRVVRSQKLLHVIKIREYNAPPRQVLITHHGRFRHLRLRLHLPRPPLAQRLMRDL